MAKIKRSIKKQRAMYRELSLGVSFIAFSLVFFEFILMLHGDWDDMSYRVVFIAPFVSAVGLIFAIVNISKYRAKGFEIIAPLSMVAISALFFCFVMVYSSTMMLS